MKKINILTVLLIFLISQFVKSQNTSGDISQLKEDLNLFNAPSTTSPERASIEKFGYYPVDYSVGVPDISIPIYTIQSSTLNFPITLSYHLSGIKVDDIANWVGLGWSLNSFGAVNIKHNPQDVGGGFKDTNACKLPGPLYKNGKAVSGLISPIPETQLYLYDDQASRDNETAYSSMMDNYYNPIDRGALPTKANEYTYNANGISGYFTYNINRELVQVPSTDRKISLNGNVCTITTETGDRYIFETKQRVQQTGTNNSSERVKTLSEDMLLTKIISSNNTDTISFNYTSSKSYQDEKESFALFAGKDEYLIPQGVSGTGLALKETNFYYTDGRSGWYTYSEERLLSSIEFKSGIIEFNTGKRQKDTVRDFQLNSISISSKGNNGTKKLIKKVSFDYTSQGPARLFLDKLNFWSPDNKKVQEYKFTYHKDVSKYGSKGQDYWGYDNGVISNYSMVPKDFIPESTDGYGLLLNYMGNRKPSETSMKRGSLYRIDYPTGGCTVFSTEAHRDENDNIIGGLRVFRIVSKAQSDSPEIIQEFNYEKPYVLFTPDRTHYILTKYGAFNREGFGSIKPRIYYIDNPSFVSSYKGAAITYQKVTKTESDSNGKINGKTIYYYQAPSMHKQIYQQEFEEFGGAETRLSRFTPTLWKMGKHKKVEYYEGKEILPVKMEDYTYETYNEKSEEIGFILSSTLYQFNTAGYGNLPMTRSAKDFKRFQWYYAYTGIENLTSRKDSIYDKSSKQYIVSEHSYKYGNISATNKNHLLTEEDIKDSNGQSINVLYKYPQDFSATIAIYKSMLNANMLAYPIEKTVKKGSKVISKSKIDYAAFPSILPCSKQISKQGSEYQLEFTYDSYDSYGNLTQMTNEKNGISTSFIWGYKGQYPIAEIQNAKYSDIVSVVTDNTLKSILSSYEPTAANFTAINNLRQNQKFSNSFITTYKYTPLTGVTEITNPNGLITYYDYDTSGRLKNTKDNDKKLLSLNEYNYVNQATIGDIPPFEPLNIEYLSSSKDCPPNEIQKYVIKASGGSGKYTYTWSIKDTSGNILKEETNETGQIEITYLKAGTITIVCTVKDKKYTMTRFIKESITVTPLVQLKNVTSVKKDGDSYKVTADINCPDKTTVILDLSARKEDAECEAFMDTYNIQFTIGTKTYKYYDTKTETIELALPKGNTKVEISILNKANCSMGTATLQIKATKSPVYKIGASYLYNSFIN